jgi:hypothetical protein
MNEKCNTTEETTTKATELREDVDNLRHMLGAAVGSPKKEWGYRNYYAANPGDASMERLAALGLVRKGRAVPGGLVYWHATELGCAIAGIGEKATRRALND